MFITLAVVSLVSLKAEVIFYQDWYMAIPVKKANVDQLISSMVHDGENFLMSGAGDYFDVDRTSHLGKIFCCENKNSGKKQFYTYSELKGVKSLIYIEIDEEDIKEDAVVYVEFRPPSAR
jgi:hypothetical protein